MGATKAHGGDYHLAPEGDQAAMQTDAVAFFDDLSRLRAGNGPQNMVVVEDIATNSVRNPKDRHGLKNRRKLANLNPGGLGTLIRRPAPST